MRPNDQLTEARRWLKFPATVLFAMSLLWLLDTYFTAFSNGFGPIAQQAETFVGTCGLLISFVIIPLGGILVGIGLLVLSRKAFVGGIILPLIPLVIVSGEKFSRIATKFSEFHAKSTQNDPSAVSSFGGGVMTALLVLALWAVYAMLVLYIYKGWRICCEAQEWLKLPVCGKLRGAAPQPFPNEPEKVDEGDVCFLMPDADAQDND